MMTTAKFWAYSQKEKIDLMQEIAKLSELVGAEIPSDKTNAMIVDRIIAKFPQESFSELNEAITMACTNDLKDLEGGKIDHYGKMSFGYIGQIMASFKRYKQDKKAEPPRPTEASRQLGAANEVLLWKAEYVSMLKWIRDDGGIIPSTGNFHHCFNYLKSTGRFGQINYTETIHQSKHWVNQEADKLGSPQLRKDYRDFFNKKSPAFINLCRQNYFIQWLQDQFMNNLDANDSPLEWIETELRNIDKQLAA